MIRVLLILCATVAVASAALGRDLYRSDFAAASQPAQLKDWQLSAGRYRLADGWLEVASDNSNPQARLTAKIDGGAARAAVTFRATVRNARNCHRTWMLVNGAYQLELNNQFGRLELHRLGGAPGAAGPWKMLAEAANYDRYARDRHAFELRLVLSDGRVRAFIDDKKLIDCEDVGGAAPAAGGSGLALGGGWGSDVAWRDIRVSDQADLAQWPIEPAVTPSKMVNVTWVRGLAEDNTYFDGEKAGFNFRISTTQPAPENTVRLTYRLVDVHEKVVAETSQDVTLKPGDKAGVQLRAEFTPPARGAFRIALWAAALEQPPAWVEDIGCFVVLAKSVGERPHNADSYLGGHMDGINLAWHLRAGRRLGVQWARCHDMLQHTWWTRIQPTGGDEWKWSDATQKTLDDLSFSTLGEFLWTPPWASGGKERTAPPKDDADFARYVRETVSHYRGSIRHWEVWNEPHYHGFWSGTPEQYAHLLAVAYREAKKADPACTVLGGGGVSLGSKAWIGKMIAALPDERCMDAFSIHYLVPDSAKADLAWLRATLKDKGRNIDVPIWNTEESVLTSSFLDQSRQGYREPEARYHFRNACCELVRTYMENIANGVQRVFYYELADPWRQGEFPKPRVPAEKNALGTGMWDDGRMPRPIAAAHAALAMAIEGKTFSSRITRPGRAAFIFQDKDSATAVLYVPFATFAQKTTLKLAIPPGAKASDFALIDFMGNQTPVDAKAQTIEITLSREPVYLTWATRGGGDVLRRLLDAGND